MRCGAVRGELTHRTRTTPSPPDPRPRRPSPPLSSPCTKSAGATQRARIPGTRTRQPAPSGRCRPCQYVVRERPTATARTVGETTMRPRRHAMRCARGRTGRTVFHEDVREVLPRLALDLLHVHGDLLRSPGELHDEVRHAWKWGRNGDVSRPLSPNVEPARSRLVPALHAPLLPLISHSSSLEMYTPSLTSSPSLCFSCCCRPPGTIRASAPTSACVRVCVCACARAVEHT